MAAMTYSDWLTAMTTLLQVADTAGTTAFTALAPRFIEYAENRIYREAGLDFLFTRAVDLTQSTVAGTRAVAIPASFYVVEGASLVTPAATLPSAANATRIPLLRTTRQHLDLIWPVETLTKTPNTVSDWYFALYSMQQLAPAPASADEPVSLPSTILIAPTPDAIYKVEFTGVQRPAALSVSNTTTYLTTYFPSLFIAASMVIASGYQRDFGAQSDDPRLALSWETQYQALLRVSTVEAARQKSQGFKWTAEPPPAMAEPPAPVQ